jgi:hypothetical protein
MKMDKIGGDWFCWFTKNRSVKFGILKILGNFVIKTSKKLVPITRF